MSYNAYSTVEHMGTHMDAPYHFNATALKMDEVPLADLMGPLVKIDITERAQKVADSEVTLDDVLKWEEKYGKVPEHSFVLMSSGWDRYYGVDVKFIGIRKVSILKYL